MPANIKPINTTHLISLIYKAYVSKIVN